MEPEDADERRRRWRAARNLNLAQRSLADYAHCHEEWQDNVDEARRDEIKDRVTRAAHDGLLSAAALRDILDRLACIGDPTALELELDAAGIPDIYIPADTGPGDQSG